MMRRKNHWPLFAAVALLAAFPPADAELRADELPFGNVRPLLKAQVARPLVSSDAASKQVITELADYLLKYGNDDHIGKNLATVIGLSRPAPIKTQIIEEKEDLKVGTRSVLQAGLVYEVPPGYPKVRGNRPLSIYVLSVNTSGLNTRSLFFQVNLNGLPERAVASHAKDDELALPVRGSGVKFERDLSDMETWKSYDASINLIRDWLANPPIPPVNDPAREDMQVAYTLAFERTQSDIALLRSIRGEISVLGNQLKKKKLSRMQHAQAVGPLKAQVIEIVSKNHASPVYSEAAAIMIELGDLVAASNYVDNAIDKWGVVIPMESTDWQVEDIRWSRRDGADAYAMNAALLNAKGDINGAAHAADAALRLDPQCARAAEERATANRKVRHFYEKKLRQAAELTPPDYDNAYKLGLREMGMEVPTPRDKVIEQLMRPDYALRPGAIKSGPERMSALQVISRCFLLLLIGGLFTRLAAS